MTVAVTRRQLARFGAPAAFLLAVTVAVLLVRAGLDNGAAGVRSSTLGPVRPASTAPADTKAATTGPGTTAPATAKQYVTVQKGDTFFAIATKAGISVADVEALNPGVSSNALHVGQKIRVK